ncbi:hypothetical protein [Janthinobacterium sp.]|uniref:hypothetical protein n=1 Tax=Janthinobacterium sp. TaxID=1871054 RepID=UPI00293D914B|nr:hypothetical protein [Janthinobacterium sp.]
MMMKNESMMLLAVAVAISLYMVKKAKAATPSTTAPTRTTEIIPNGDANGWRYFSDGTAIGPDGVYYKGGNVIYNPNGTMPA